MKAAIDNMVAKSMAVTNQAVFTKNKLAGLGIEETVY